MRALTYQEYLFSRLLCLVNEEYNQMEYDSSFDLIPGLYKEFLDSPYNKPSEPEYECILAYLKSNGKTMKVKFYFTLKDDENNCHIAVIGASTNEELNEKFQLSIKEHFPDTNYTIPLIGIEDFMDGEGHYLEIENEDDEDAESGILYMQRTALY